MKTSLIWLIVALNLLTALPTFVILVFELHYPRGAWEMYEEVYVRGLLNEDALREAFPKEAQMSGREQFHTMSKRLVGPNSFDLLTHSACVLLMVANTVLLLLSYVSREIAEPSHPSNPRPGSVR